MKKLFCALLFALLLTSLCACGSTAENPVADIRIAYISDVVSLDTGSEKYVTSAFEEISQYYDISYDVFTPASESEITEIVTEVLASDSYNLIIGSSYSVNSQLKQLMTDDTKALIALLGTTDPSERVASVCFKTEESAFLAGYLAASTSTSGTIGYVGGMDTQYEEYEVGYEAGAKFFNDKIKLVKAYANSYNNVSDGYNAAQSVILGGADVVFAHCAASGIGVERSCAEHGTKLILSDLYTLNSSSVIANTEKSYKNAAIYIVDAFINSLADNRVSSLRGNYRYGIEYNLVNITLNSGVNTKLSSDISEMRTYIRTGAIVVPKNSEELKSFLSSIPSIKQSLTKPAETAPENSESAK